MEKNESYIWSVINVARGEVSLEQTRNVLALYFLHQYAEVSPHLDVPEDATLEVVIRSGMYNPHYWEEALRRISYQNRELEEIIHALYPTGLEERTLMRLLVHLSEASIPTEQLGSLFSELNWRLEQSMGKAGGAWSTPSSINELGVQILQPTFGNFYDGTAGIGYTLLTAKQYADERGQKLRLYGEEVYRESWALGKIHLWLHDVQDAQFACTDVLFQPAFLEEKKFDFVMMAPPYGIRLDSHRYETLRFDPYGRFNYGVPPRSSADMAFVLHALASLQDTGKAIVVLPNGPLFRGAAEAAIRKALLQADVVEAVIALPEQLHLYTNIPVNLLVLNRNKPAERRGKILFINADKEFEQVDRRTRKLGEEHVEKILQAFHSGIESEQFSKFVDVRDIRDGNLLASTYLKMAEQHIEGVGMVRFDQQAFEALSRTRPLQSLATLYRGINILPREIEEGEGIYRIIRVSDVQGGELQLDKLELCEILTNARTDSYLVQAGDVIISSRGSSIKIAVIPPHVGKLLLSQNFIGIRPKGQLDPFFLKAYLESPVGQFLLAGMQVGTTITTISPKNLGELPVPQLDLDAQHQIGRSVQESQEQYQQALQEAELKKQEALQRVYQQMGIDEVYTIDR